MIATFVATLHQLAVMRRGSKAQNILSIVNFLQDPRVREARTEVRRHLTAKDYVSWTQDDKLYADIVCSNYDVLAVLLLKENLVNPDLFLDNWGPSIRHCFEVLKPHIEEMQKPNNSGPYYWDDFGKLYAAVTVWTPTRRP